MSIGGNIRLLLEKRRTEILALARQHKATNVRVFGSVARGQATADSDIDLLVDFAPDCSLWDQIGLWQDLNTLLRRKVDVADAQRLRPEFRDEILRDAVPL